MNINSFNYQLNYGSLGLIVGTTFSPIKATFQTTISDFKIHTALIFIKHVSRRKTYFVFIFQGK